MGGRESRESRLLLCLGCAAVLAVLCCTRFELLLLCCFYYLPAFDTTAHVPHFRSYFSSTNETLNLSIILVLRSKAVCQVGALHAFSFAAFVHTHKRRRGKVREQVGREEGLCVCCARGCVLGSAVCCALLWAVLGAVGACSPHLRALPPLYQSSSVQLLDR